MRTIGIAVAFAFVAACSSNGGDNNSDGGNQNPDGGNTNPDGGNTNPDGGGGGGWKTMTLPSPHDGDEITGIFYSSATAGFIATVPGQNANAGAVLAVTATSVGAIAFDGDVSQSAGGVLGGLEFEGLLATPSGSLIAITDSNDLVSAPTLTGAFTNVKNGVGDIGGGQVAGAFFGSNLTLLGIDGNGFEKASSVPSPTAVYTDIFDPGSIPTVPDPIPNNQCQDAVEVGDSFESGLTAVTFSADGNTIAYTTLSDADAVPEVCVSKDGGQTFLPTELTGKPQLKPGGIIFPKPSDASTLIVYSGDLVEADANYVLRSTNGGTSFTPVTLPTGLTAKKLQLYGAFFLADGMHGWIVGYDGSADTGLALVTSDGGQTWTLDATVAAATASGVQKLHSVFALDTSHVWMGGENGTLIAHTP
jgi:hypothetical protein